MWCTRALWRILKLVVGLTQALLLLSVSVHLLLDYKKKLATTTEEEDTVYAAASAVFFFFLFLILILILMNYAATSSCLAILQQSRACAVHNYLVLATKVLKLSTLFVCTTLSSSWFQSTVVLGNKEVFPLLSVTVGPKYDLLLCLAYLFTGLSDFPSSCRVRICLPGLCCCRNYSGGCAGINPSTILW